jgi:hypothetical protein
MCWKVGREKGATPSQIALAWFPELQSHNNLKVFAKPRLSDVIQKREAPFSRSTSLIVLLLSFIIKYPSKLWDHRHKHSVPRMHGETARQGGVRRPAVPEIRGTIGKRHGMDPNSASGPSHH